MIRITTGKLKNRQIDYPDGIRPMTERVRKAIFDILHNRIQNSSLLDVFAGSGAVGIEAVSQGAEHVTFIDNQGKSLKAIRENTRRMGIEEQTEIIQGEAEKETQDLKRNFDIIVADPPYSDLPQISWESIIIPLKDKGVLFISHSTEYEAPEIEGMELVKTYEYGTSALSAYRSGEPVA